MNPIFNSRDPEFCSPTGAVEEGTRIHFKIRLPRSLGCTSAYLVVNNDSGDGEVCSMFWCGLSGYDEEFWECHFVPKEAGLYWYRFELETRNGRNRVSRTFGGEGHLFSGHSWQLTVYEKGFQTPDWLAGGIMYQIFPDRFYSSGEPKENIPADRTMRSDWFGQPEWRPNEKGEVTNSDYFGGDLKGIEQKLDYLQSLGVTCLYLNPIFEAHSNHRYNTADYSKIDPVLGSEQDFRSLCAAARKRGIHILLDGVFSHTGSDSIYFNRENRYENKGAYNSKESPYYSWYKFSNWPEQYHSWWGFVTLPEVEETDRSYNEYINGDKGIARKWIQAGSSGWRLDVADELPDSFLDNLREAVKEEDPDAVILGEVWEDASNKEAYSKRRRYLLGRQLDSVMNYPFRDAILGFLTGADARQMLDKILTIIENYPPQVTRLLMNHIGTHDTERAITVLAGEPSCGRGREWQSAVQMTPSQKEHGIRLMKVASAMQFTLPGIPCIYYGDEVGMEGYKDPFNRAGYPWGEENNDLLSWYRNLAQIRKASKVLAEGRLVPVFVDVHAVAYVRQDSRMPEEPALLCAFNAGGDTEYIPLLPDWRDQCETLLGGKVWGEVLTLQPYSCCILRRKPLLEQKKVDKSGTV